MAMCARQTGASRLGFRKQGLRGAGFRTFPVAQGFPEPWGAEHWMLGASWIDTFIHAYCICICIQLYVYTCMYVAARMFESLDSI